MIEIIIGIGVGVVVGMYITSQIAGSIDRNIQHKKFIKNMEEYDEKEKIKQ